ncbi:hypothetical protein [Streptomyces mutabilis]|uniref:hypothetical protein n=1 Tax=Streptomyces mutabilis TaxID=67332 RepID=UPI000B221E55
MPSVVGLLELRELGARRRLDELREEADRIQAEVAVAELEGQQWVIARGRVDAVLTPKAATPLARRSSRMCGTRTPTRRPGTR